MVRRYSHKAIVTIQSGQLVKGEWVAGEPTEIEVTGQYFPSNSGQQLKRNVDGKEFIVHGEFSTKARPVENAKHMHVNGKKQQTDSGKSIHINKKDTPTSKRNKGRLLSVKYRSSF